MSSLIMNRYHVHAAIIFCALVLIIAGFTSPEDFKYEAKGKRDPFVPLIGPDRMVVAGLEDITSIADANLEGIATGAQGKKIAIINGEMLKEGDKIGSLEVKKITSRMVVLAIGGKEYNLSLPEEGEAKGEK